MEELTKPIEVLTFEIAKLELRPNDVLVARLPEDSRDAPQAVLEILINVVPGDVGIAVFKGDIEFTRIRDTSLQNKEEDSE